MVTKVRKILFFPKKIKANRIVFEHRIGVSPYTVVTMYNVDFPTALFRFKNIIDIKIGFIKISGLYGESRFYEYEVRVSELLEHYATTESLLY